MKNDLKIQAGQSCRSALNSSAAQPAKRAATIQFRLQRRPTDSVKIFVLPPTVGKTQAFTLIGLVVVVAVSAFLAAMMLPMLTRAKQASQTSVCANNLKQLGMGINVYADDNKQTYCPACLEDEGHMTGGPLSWDVWIDHYIGGNQNYSQLGSTGGGGSRPSLTPKCLRCPADTGVNQAFAYGMDSVVARRSYAMVIANPQLNGFPNCTPPYYPPLPAPKQGIGVNWTELNEIVDWHAPGYPIRTIQDAAGTILLAEMADGDNFAGNAWMSTLQGPTNNTAGPNAGYIAQLDPSDPWNYGTNVYAAHGQKFNYLFHDNHVSILTWQQTLGTTPTNSIPNGPWYGMWTIPAGD